MGSGKTLPIAIGFTSRGAARPPPITTAMGWGAIALLQAGLFSCGRTEISSLQKKALWRLGKALGPVLAYMPYPMPRDLLRQGHWHLPHQPGMSGSGICTMAL